MDRPFDLQSNFKFRLLLSRTAASAAFLGGEEILSHGREIALGAFRIYEGPPSYIAQSVSHWQEEVSRDTKKARNTL